MRASRTHCWSAAPPSCRGHRRRSRSLRGGARRGRRRRPRSASSRPTSSTRTTCCRCSARAGSRPRARQARRVRAAPAQPAPLLRDRRRGARRRPLLSLPPPQHAAGACPQLPRLAARGRGLRRGARAPPAGRLRDAWTASSLRAATPRGSSALLGVPADRLEVLPHYLPAEAFAERSAGGPGDYALVAARLSPEKGLDVAVEAAAASRRAAAGGGRGAGRGRACRARGARRSAGGVPRPPRAGEPARASSPARRCC